MSDKQSDIGKRLKKVRLELDMTQEDFSIKLLGSANRATISAYETGRLPISDKAKVILFTTLSVNKDWLESGEGEMFLVGEKDRKIKNHPLRNEAPSGKTIRQHVMEFKAFLYGKIQNLSYPTPQMRKDIEDLQEELEFMKKLLKEREETEGNGDSTKE